MMAAWKRDENISQIMENVWKIDESDNLVSIYLQNIKVCLGQIRVNLICLSTFLKYLQIL